MSAAKYLQLLLVARAVMANGTVSVMRGRTLTASRLQTVIGEFDKAAEIARQGQNYEDNALLQMAARVCEDAWDHLR